MRGYDDLMSQNENLTSELDVSEIAPPAAYDLDSEMGIDKLKTLNHGYTSDYTDVTRNQIDKKKAQKRATADQDDDS